VPDGEGGVDFTTATGRTASDAVVLAFGLVQDVDHANMQDFRHDMFLLSR
jgi:hypothetical protein